MKLTFLVVIVVALAVFCVTLASGTGTSFEAGSSVRNISYEFPSADQYIPNASFMEKYIPNASVEYYDISGSTWEEISKQLRELGPGGGEFAALTSWHYDTDCQMAKWLDYTIKVKFPRWMPPKDATPELIEKWKEFVKKSC